MDITKLRNEKGYITIMIVLIIPLIFLIIGCVIDIGRLILETEKLVESSEVALISCSNRMSNENIELSSDIDSDILEDYYKESLEKNSTGVELERLVIGGNYITADTKTKVNFFFLKIIGIDEKEITSSLTIKFKR